MAPEDTTRRSILMQGVNEDQSRRYLAAFYECGCWNRADKWSLCQYHEGFDDGVEAERSLIGGMMRDVYEYLPEDVCHSIKQALSSAAGRALGTEA